VVEDVSEDDEDEGSSNNDESTSSAAMVVFVLVGVVVFAASVAGLCYFRRRLTVKNQETITSINTGMELTAVHVQTPTASPTATEVSRQPPKVGSVIGFLEQEAKISSARTMQLAEKFAERGYEIAGDFEEMTAAELSDEYLGGVIGLFLPEIRKFRTARSRCFDKVGTVGSSDAVPAADFPIEHMHKMLGISSMPTRGIVKLEPLTKPTVEL
jgi:hypothetical protein